MKRIRVKVNTVQNIAEKVLQHGFPLAYEYDLGSFVVMAMKVAEEYAATHPDLEMRGSEKLKMATDHLESIIRLAIKTGVCTEADGYAAMRFADEMGPKINMFIRAICQMTKNPDYLQTVIDEGVKCMEGCITRRRKKIKSNTK